MTQANNLAKQISSLSYDSHFSSNLSFSWLCTAEVLWYVFLHVALLEVLNGYNELLTQDAFCLIERTSEQF